MVPPEQAEAVRRFIRHPSDIPISFKVEKQSHSGQPLRDVSCGGLCFNSDCALQRGESVHIEIPLGDIPGFEADAVVTWCQLEGDHFAVGVQFENDSTAFSVRMVEQICHIEDYRTKVRLAEGRDLSSEEAAREWIDKYAEDFPPH